MSRERALLRGLLERYSPTGQEKAVSRYLVECFRSAGLPAQVDEVGNFVGTAGDGPTETVLLGHIDTVPGEIPVKERDGKLYGRGAVDAKGPMATFVSAALRLSEGDQLRNMKLTVIGAVGEEGDSNGARHILHQYQPSHLVIGEPGGWDSLVLGYKGSLRVRYTFARSARHSAGPDDSVPETAIAFWQKVRSLAGGLSEGKRVFDQVSPSLRAINTGSDGFTDRVGMDINVRLPLNFGPQELEPHLRDWADGAELEIAYGDPAWKGEKNTALVRAFLGALRDAGAQPRFKVKTGTSDMNVVAPVWGCPTLAYGPGDSTLDHTPEEHILLDEYDRAIIVLEEALKYLDKAEK